VVSEWSEITSFLTTRVEREKRFFVQRAKEALLKERLRCSEEPKDVWSAFGDSVVTTLLVIALETALFRGFMEELGR